MSAVLPSDIKKAALYAMLVGIQSANLKKIKMRIKTTLKFTLRVDFFKADVYNHLIF